MVIEENVSLAKYSTMRLGGLARYFVTVSSEADIEAAVSFAKDRDLKIHVLGGGSNTIFTDAGFEGLVIFNKIQGLEISKSEQKVDLSIGAGEEWDEIVSKSVELGYCDIAALSLIPGTVGGAPVQNIGAYGQQISDSIISIRAYDTKTLKWKDILQQSCNFSYRSSRFNKEDKGRYIISFVNMRLSRKIEKGPFYKDVESYCKIHDLPTSNLGPVDLRKAVIAIRQAKLPDPKLVANTGSFFKNPVINESQFKLLLKDYPALKSHKTDDGLLKLYAGQLVELAGFKNYHDKSTGMATWAKQSLVLVNENAKNTADLLNFKNKIISSVEAAFSIRLVQEPELIS
jgi:UDP-N-acetylmuramate dehydrogenase